MLWPFTGSNGFFPFTPQAGAFRVDPLVQRGFQPRAGEHRLDIAEIGDRLRRRRQRLILDREGFQPAQAGVPLAISVSFQLGELSGAPIASTPGHLMVVRGLTLNGDVIVNDPAAATDSAVRIVYQRAQLERVWQQHGGVAYVIYPPEWTVPV